MSEIEITTQPISSVTVTALEDVTLNCSASFDDVTYSWHRVNGSIPSRSVGQNSNTFTIPRATPYDEGAYYCIAKKENFSVESTKAVVRIDGKNSFVVMHYYYKSNLQIN